MPAPSSLLSSLTEPSSVEKVSRSLTQSTRCLTILSAGTQRRTRKVVTTQSVEEDKKLKATVKKFGVQPLTDIDEVNMFKEDNTVLHFRKPHSKCPSQSPVRALPAAVQPNGRRERARHR